MLWRRSLPAAGLREDAVEALISLQYARRTAERLVTEALVGRPDVDSLETLLRTHPRTTGAGVRTPLGGRRVPPKTIVIVSAGSPRHLRAARGRLSTWRLDHWEHSRSRRGGARTRWRPIEGLRGWAEGLGASARVRQNVVAGEASGTISFVTLWEDGGGTSGLHGRLPRAGGEQPDRGGTRYGSAGR